jgi:hypothetical protein
MERIKVALGRDMFGRVVHSTVNLPVSYNGGNFFIR